MIDPACGSGNFLTETFLSLRRLENEAIKLRVAAERKQVAGQMTFGMEGVNPVRVSISQFYGIEINDFAVRVAQAALWIAESQMLKETEDIVYDKIDFLPLKTNANIVEKNALQYDWAKLISPVKLSYIMGNPPFIGAYLMTEQQRNDLKLCFGSRFPGIGSLDYVSGWYKTATDYIKGTQIKCALVSTNSISQGEVAGYLWPTLFNNGISINFAHRTFIWNSEATNQAHVHCIIVGFALVNEKKKKLFDGDSVVYPENINAYLLDAPNVIVTSRGKPLCDVKKLTKGNQPTDGGHLILSQEERDKLIESDPSAVEYVKRYVGARDYLNNDQVRYCLWLKDVDPSKYYKNKEVMHRLQLVREERLRSSAAPTRKAADTPYKFFSTPQTDEPYLIIPRHSSVNRRYIPIGFMTPDIIASDACSIICGIGLYEFGILTSNVHMAWMRAVAGRLKSDYRYSGGVVYNTFPWPDVSDEARKLIEDTAGAILNTREGFSCTLAELYNPITMPPELQKVHTANDVAVMRAYGMPIKGTTEADCVAWLMRMYQELVSKS